MPPLPSVDWATIGNVRGFPACPEKYLRQRQCNWATVDNHRMKLIYSIAAAIWFVGSADSVAADEPLAAIAPAQMAFNLCLDSAVIAHDDGKTPAEQMAKSVIVVCDTLLTQLLDEMAALVRDTSAQENMDQAREAAQRKWLPHVTASILTARKQLTRQSLKSPLSADELFQLGSLGRKKEGFTDEVEAIFRVSATQGNHDAACVLAAHFMMHKSLSMPEMGRFYMTKGAYLLKQGIVNGSHCADETLAAVNQKMRQLEAKLSEQKQADIGTELLGVPSGLPVEGRQNAFAGNWCWQAAPSTARSANGPPEASFSLSLKVSGNAIAGSHCAVAQWGNRIDCAEGDEVTISGAYSVDSVEVTYTSAYSGQKGKAKLVPSGNGLIWQPQREAAGYLPDLPTEMSACKD
jgi:hypothetical protein